MNWHLALSLLVLPLALYSQLRTRKVNALALLLSPVIYLVLGAHAADAARRAGQALLLPFLLFACGAALGHAQGRATSVFYDTTVQNYRQRGGAWPLGYWAAALLLRQGAALVLTHGLPPAAARLSTEVTIDAVLAGLLAGRAVALLRRHPGLWGAGLAQLRGETTAPPPGFSGPWPPKEGAPVPAAQSVTVRPEEPAPALGKPGPSLFPARLRAAAAARGMGAPRPAAPAAVLDYHGQALPAGPAAGPVRRGGPRSVRAAGPDGGDRDGNRGPRD